jgi:hypothetical protein
VPQEQHGLDGAVGATGPEWIGWSQLVQPELMVYKVQQALQERMEQMVLTGATGADGLQGPTGATGATGANGFSCWDTNNNGIDDPSEDVNA